MTYWFGRMLMLIFLPILWLAVFPAAAQEKASSQGRTPTTAVAPASRKPVDTFPLRGIQIKGNENFPTDQIISLTRLRIGEPVKPTDFERALLKLKDTGAFEAIEFRYEPRDDGYQVTYTVAEVTELYPLRFYGFGVPDEQIRELLREKVPLFGPKVPSTGPIAEHIGGALETFWKSLGNKTEIVGILSPVGEEQLEMLFQPEGSLKTIAFTKFENAKALSPLDLQRMFYGVATGVPFTEARLKELLYYNVTPLYEEKGLLEVEFCPCRTEPDPDSEGLIVTVHVEEGEEYTFGQVEIPDASRLDEEKLTRLLKFETGDLANFAQVRNSVGAIEAHLRANGYMNVSVRFEKRLDTENKTVDVVIRIDEGDLYTFNKLSVKGLDLIGEAAVRKRWGLKAGDPFNASYPALFLNRITEERMFDNLSDTGWDMTINQERNTVDVELRFR